AVLNRREKGAELHRAGKQGSGFVLDHNGRVDHFDYFVRADRRDGIRRRSATTRVVEVHPGSVEQNRDRRHTPQFQVFKAGTKTYPAAIAAFPSLINTGDWR